MFIKNNVCFNWDMQRVTEIFAVGAGAFSPEPMEFLLFICGIIIMPLLLLLSYNFFTWLLRECFPNQCLDKLGSWLLSAAAVIIWLMVLQFVLILEPALREAAFRNIPSVFWKEIIINIAGLLVVGAFALIVNYLVRRMSSGLPLGILGKIAGLFLEIINLLLIVSASLFCVFGIRAIYMIGMLNHFEAVFHPLVQVYFGKGIGLDLQSQYGLWPQFVEPYFKVVGLDVWRFSVSMGGLMGLSLLFIYAALRKVIASKLILTLESVSQSDFRLSASLNFSILCFWVNF